jgi:hypothetical protein
MYSARLPSRQPKKNLKLRTILPSLPPHQVTPQLPSRTTSRLPSLTPQLPSRQPKKNLKLRTILPSLPPHQVTPQLPSRTTSRLPSLTPALHLHLPKVTPQLPSQQRKNTKLQLRTRLPSLTPALHLHLQSRSRLDKVSKSMSKSSKSSKSSDSTRKRYDRQFAKLIKKLPIGDAYEHVFTHFQKLREEIPDKYRYPLRDDKKYKYVLRNEIPQDKLKNSLCENPSPGVFELLFDMKFRIDWSLLVKHPDAFTKKYQLENIIKGQHSRLLWYNLFMNTNPRVIKFVNKIMEEEKNKDKKKEYYNILANNPTPEAIKIVKQVLQKFKGNRKDKILNSLADNPTPEAMELLKRIAKQKDFENNQNMWIRLLANPAAMEFIENCLWTSINKYWYIMYKNPNPKVFKFIEKFSGQKFDKNYNYDHLSENPSSKAIKILQERMNQEKSISKEDYYDLRQRKSVSIFLNWIKISKNPRAKSLILAKIEEEKDREKEIAEDRKNGYPERNLNWGYVSANPAIFKRIRKMTDEKAKDEEKAIKIERYIHPLPIKPAN